MKKSVKDLVIVLAVSAVYASGVQAGEASGEVPHKRTWGEYFSQKKAANNIFASTDSRKLARAQLKLGTLQIQQAKVDAEAKRQQDRTDKQARVLEELKTTRASIEAVNTRIETQTKAAKDSKALRDLIRKGKAIPGIVKISVSEIETKVGPKFLAYVNNEKRSQNVIERLQKAALEELNKNAKARDKADKVALEDTENLKDKIVAAKKANQDSVDFPVAYTAK